MQNKHRKPSVRSLLGCLFLWSLTFCLWLNSVPFITFQGGFEQQATAQLKISTARNRRAKVNSPDVSQLVQEGLKLDEAGDFKGAIKQWQKALSFYKKNHDFTKALSVIENLAKAHQQLGESKEAIAYWEEAIAYYDQIKNLPQVGRMLVEKSVVYNSLGEPGKAIASLASALEIARIYNDKTLQAIALGCRGEAYRVQGDYKQAIRDLQDSLKLAQARPNLGDRASTLNSLGNAYISLAMAGYRRANSALEAGDNQIAEKLKKQAFIDDSQALEYFQQSLNINSELSVVILDNRSKQRQKKLNKMRFLLNVIPPIKRTKQSNLAIDFIQKALALLKTLPDSPDKVYAAIKLANLVQFRPIDPISPLVQCPRKIVEQRLIETLLNKAISIAKKLQDYRTLSFALGNRGHIYECQKDYKSALNFTQEALRTAEKKLNARDSLYLWEWQTGRILKAQKQIFEAIKAYERSCKTLENIHSEIFITNQDLNFDFRDTVETMYRELIETRLSLEDSEYAFKKNYLSDNLNAVLATVDYLKMVELQNYFIRNCVLTEENEKNLDLVTADKATAVFNFIILKDHTAIITTFPNGQNKLKWIDIDSKTLKQEINKFRIGLEKRSDIIYNPQQAQKLYNWIIRPVVKDLESLQIKTLVFIPDGILRSVPLSALHDGKKYLIEKYAIATVPSLALTDLTAANHQNLRALLVGLTKDAMVDGQFYQALDNVGEEINQVEARLPGSKQLLDENFTSDRLRNELSKTAYPIIHIATHGEFGNIPEDTFLVTGDNEKLTMNDLDSIIRNLAKDKKSVDLLTLTACETAIGDDRAALGLAGVAVHAGVKSALASLWSIDDASTVKFVTKFYEDWRNPGVSKAQALRTAQQALISTGKKYAHPSYWAPFILIGNWL
jgi:CHAT domain-containing protein